MQIYCSLCAIAVLRACQKYVLSLKSAEMPFGTIGYKELIKVEVSGVDPAASDLHENLRTASLQSSSLKLFLHNLHRNAVFNVLGALNYFPAIGRTAWCTVDFSPLRMYVRIRRRVCACVKLCQTIQYSYE